MANKTTKVLRFVFQTETASKTYSMEFINPKDGLTEAEIRSAMQTIIDKDIILSKNGRLTGIVSAKIIQKSYISLLH